MAWWRERGRVKLYGSYALSTWGDRSWTFALSVALFEVGGDLFLPALSNLLNSAAVILSGVVVGRLIDRSSRLGSARVALAGNNLLVALSAAALTAVLLWGEALDDGLRWGLVAASLLFCAAAEVSGGAGKIVVGKDWVVAMSRGRKEDLAELNTAMVSIDQTCGILSPILAGLVMSLWSYAAGCAFVGLWNVVSFPLEYVLLKRLHDSVPELAAPKPPRPVKAPSKEARLPAVSQDVSLIGPHKPSTEFSKALLEVDRSVSLVEDAAPAPAKRTSRSLSSGLKGLARGWGVYFAQPVWGAGAALALLYFTVLGLDGITSSYIVSQGVSAAALGGARAAGAVSGIAGSLLFPGLRSRLGLRGSGVFGLGLETAFLLLPLASVFLPGSPFRAASTATNASLASTGANWTEAGDGGSVAVWVLVGGIVGSRAGLWTADLSLTQTMQEAVAETERGLVFGCQASAQQALSLAKDLLVIALPSPQTFGYLILVSVVAVASALLLFLLTAFRRGQGEPDEDREPAEAKTTPEPQSPEPSL